MAYWLVKSEPDVFGWDHQVANGVASWTGVRNHMARNNLQAMREGDFAFFYHSNTGREIVGVVRVVREAYPDPTVEAGEKGDWVCVDVTTVERLKVPVTLAQLKAHPDFQGMALLRLSRLSVAPVTDVHWAAIRRMGGLGA